MSERKVKVWTIDHRVGTFFGAETATGLCALSIPVHSGRDFALLLDRRAPGAAPESVEPDETASGRQLLAWLQGRSTSLDAPLDLAGLTGFTVAVLKAVAAIPFGQTRTYGSIARQVGRPGA
ncbi:MAG: MGMT family protein, partial [Pseudomonadota bacterium]